MKSLSVHIMLNEVKKHALEKDTLLQSTQAQIADLKCMDIKFSQAPFKLGFHTQVYEQSIASACQLDWPKDRILIQVLDDSSDEVLQILIRNEANSWREKGVMPVKVLLFFQRLVIFLLTTEAHERGLLESFGALRGFEFVKDGEIALNGIKMGDKTLTVRWANQVQSSLGWAARTRVIMITKNHLLRRVTFLFFFINFKHHFICKEYDATWGNSHTSYQVSIFDASVNRGRARKR